VYASQSGRARTSPKNPQAHAICDRCGFRYNHVDLQWQYDWRGATTQNLKILVCRECNDVPQEQLRAIVVPADPTPIINARIEWFAQDETDYRTVAQPATVSPTTGLPVYPTTVLGTDGNLHGIQIVNQSGNNLTTQTAGPPTGVTHSPSLPSFGSPNYSAPLSVLSITGSNSYLVTVTCSAPHGLSTNAQVTVEGTSSNYANGTYSVTVTTATAFTYYSNQTIPGGSLLLGNTAVYPVNIGLPINFVQQPQTGI